MTTPIHTRFRFEIVCEAIAPDGTRTRVGGFDIPSGCIVCGVSVIGDDLKVWARLGNTGGRFGMICLSHDGRWVGSGRKGSHA